MLVSGICVRRSWITGTEGRRSMWRFLIRWATTSLKWSCRIMSCTVVSWRTGKSTFQLNVSSLMQLYILLFLAHILLWKTQCVWWLVVLLLQIEWLFRSRGCSSFHCFSCLYAFCDKGISNWHCWCFTRYSNLNLILTSTTCIQEPPTTIPVYHIAANVKDAKFTMIEPNSI